ncbi:TPA: hypothetical protein ACGD4M_002680 [Serratia marcescens]
MDYQIKRDLIKEPFTADEIAAAKVTAAEMEKRANECRLRDGVIYNDEYRRQTDATTKR